MRPPKDIDAVALLYAVDSLCERKPLRSMGLNRRGYREAKKAQDWFFCELVKAVNKRKKRIIRKKRKH